MARASGRRRHPGPAGPLLFIAALMAATSCTTTSSRSLTTTSAAAPTCTCEVVPSATPCATRTASNTPTASATGVQVGHLIVAGGNTGIGQWTSAVYVGTVFDNGDVLSWTSTTALPSGLSWAGIAIGQPGGYVLLAGGDTGVAATSATYTGLVDASGLILAWVPSTPMPTALCCSASAAASASRLVVAGGRDAASGSQASDEVLVGTVAGGTFVSWTTGAVLPQAASYGNLAEVNGNFYYLYSGFQQNLTTSSAPAVPGPWAAAPPGRPAARGGSFGFAAGNRIFDAGGFSFAARDEIFSSAVGGTGVLSSWTTSSAPLPVPAGGAAGLFVPGGTTGFVFILGGAAAGGVTESSVYVASFGGGSLSPWSSSPALPVPLRAMAVWH